MYLLAICMLCLEQYLFKVFTYFLKNQVILFNVVVQVLVRTAREEKRNDSHPNQKGRGKSICLQMM